MTNIQSKLKIHIGKRVREVFLSQNKMTVVAFAKALCCERQNIYRIFNKDTIDIELLARISQVLEHDFFMDISDSLRDNTGVNKTDT